MITLKHCPLPLRAAATCSVWRALGPVLLLMPVAAVKNGASLWSPPRGGLPPPPSLRRLRLASTHCGRRAPRASAAYFACALPSPAHNPSIVSEHHLLSLHALI